MLNTRRTTTGKIYAPIDSIQVWDKNPRQIDRPEDFERLKRQLSELGQYKPLLVTEDGIVIGGNMRLRAMADMFNAGNKNFEEVWVTELSFGEVERTHEEITAGKPVEYRALIDGKLQERQFSSVEQIMIEYALSDNDAVGTYKQQELAELVQPYLPVMPQGRYKLSLSPEVKLETFVDQYQPDGKDGPGLDPENDEKKSKFIVMRLQFTPDQFQEVEPQIERIKKQMGIENNSDLLTRLLEIAEESDMVKSSESNGLLTHPDTPPSPEEAGVTTEEDTSEVPSLPAEESITTPQEQTISLTPEEQAAVDKVDGNALDVIEAVPHLDGQPVEGEENA